MLRRLISYCRRVVPDSLVQAWSAVEGGTRRLPCRQYVERNTQQKIWTPLRAYAAGAKISLVCNEYPGVREQTIRLLANLLKNSVALEKLGPPPILREKLEGGLRD